ncbi:sulfate transporter CysZ [Pseudomarimonas arenosa]|uniref:sulfate transporter CysZ n=1 Tax=Pseudomarimonas arenosa TaxID=2774145 RepID=UPI001CDCFCD6|nr:sulfate transporter CysZ [Pseudomarimonas arenosa]
MTSGPGGLIRGFRWLTKPGMKRFVVLPILGNMLIFALASMLLFFALELAMDRWLPEDVSWLRYLLFPLAAVAMLIASLFSFTLLANLLLGPFLGALSAKVWRELGREMPEVPYGGMWSEFRFDLGIELRRLGYSLLCLLGVFLLGFVPIVQLIAAPLGVLVGAWLLAFEFVAHPLGPYRLSLAEQLRFLREHRWMALGFGLATMGALLVPLLNLAVVPAAAAGMTILTHERFRPA